jgi:hypothetical protein
MSDGIALALRGHMRFIFLVPLLLATACLGSVRDRALALKAKVASLDIHVDPNAAAAIAQSQLEARTAAAPAPEPAPDDTATVTANDTVTTQAPAVVRRVDRATPTAFVARYQAANGWTCQKFSTIDACNRECTSRIALAAKMGGSTQCSCTQDAPCN